MKLRETFGGVAAKAVLCAVFFLLLVPIALLVRVVKGEGMALSKRPRNTLWRAVGGECAASDLEDDR